MSSLTILNKTIYEIFNSPFESSYRRFFRTVSSTYTAVEAPKGEFGEFVVSDGNNQINDGLWVIATKQIHGIFSAPF